MIRRMPYYGSLLSLRSAPFYFKHVPCKMLFQSCPPYVSRAKNFSLMERLVISRLSSTTSAIRTVKLQHKEGSYSFFLHLNDSSEKDQRILVVSPHMSLGDIASMIKSEKVSDVYFQNHKQHRLEPSWQLRDIIEMDCELVIDELVYPIQHPVYAEPMKESLTRASSETIRSFIKMACIIDVRKKLEAHPHAMIQYKDYLDICNNCGVSTDHASKLIHDFHRSGILFYFPRSTNEEIKSTIFLRTAGIVDGYLESIGLMTSTSVKIRSKKNVLENQLAESLPEKEALESLHTELQETATKHANVVSFVSSLGLVSSFGFYWWLSFVHYSWDIMEPVTYFTGLGVSMIGYLWWSATNADYEYENIYDWLYKKKLSKLCFRRGLDVAQMKKKAEQVNELKKHLESIEHIRQQTTSLQVELMQLHNASNDKKA